MTAQPSRSADYGALYTVDDYLELEQHARDRHEYHGGHVYLMAGGTAAHSAIAARVIAELDRQLRDSPCRVHTSDMLIRQSALDLSYADAAVTCDARDMNPTTLVIDHPRLIVEVLSPHTASYDEGAKLALWQAMPSVEWIVLIDSRGRRPARLWQRGADGGWLLAEVSDSIVLDGLNVTLDVATLYQTSGLEPA